MRTTTIQISQLTEYKIEQLREWGYGVSLIDVLRRAVDEAWTVRYVNANLNKRDIQPPPPPKKEQT
jgi:hypothetical protein